MRVAPRHLYFVTLALMTTMGAVLSATAYAAGLRGPEFVAMTFLMGAAGTLLLLLMAAVVAVRRRVQK
jgi:hypothetical protein